MKKVLFLVIVVSAFFAACSENTLNRQTEETRSIQFSNLRGRVTRANQAGANDSKDDYRVYASNSLSATNWYIDDTVDGTTNVPNNGPYYWLNNTVTYNFYAYAPASVVASGAADALTVTDYVVPATAQQDFTVAVPVKGMTYATSAAGTVNLVFHHVLSKIQVNVSLAQKLLDAGYTVENNYTADLEVVYDKGNVHFLDPTLINMTWDNYQRTSTGSNLVYSGAKSYMIMPQQSYGTSQSCSVTLKGITVKKNGIQVFPISPKTGDLSKFTFTAANMSESHFHMGKVYNLNFELSDVSTDDDGDLVFGKEIKFSATHADWTQVSIDLDQP